MSYESLLRTHKSTIKKNQPAKSHIMDKSMEDLPDVEVKKSPNPIFRKDRHLSSALLVTEIEYMLTYKNTPRALKREHVELLQDMEKRKCTLTLPCHFNSWCMKQVLGNNPVSSSNRAELQLLVNAACGACSLAREDWTGVRQNIEKNDLPSLIGKVYDRKCKFDTLFDEITFDERFVVQRTAAGIKGVAYGNLHMVEHREGRVFVITHAMLAGVRDMISAWFDTLLYSFLYNDKYPGFSFYKEVEDCIMVMAAHAYNHPIDVYAIMKLWPSICIGSS